MSRKEWSAAAGALAVLFALHVWWLRGLAEDAFISFRYGRHLAAGRGLVWNLGEPPVEGYTNFLWVLLSAAFDAIGVDVPTAARAVGVLAAFATLALVARAARVGLGWSRGASLVPVGLLAVSGCFAAWADAGLETSLFALLVMLALFHAARFAADARSADAIALAAAVLLAALTRPEGVLVAVLAAPFAALGGKRRGVLVSALGVAGLLFAGYFAWRWSYFGYPLPNTYYAKTGGGIAQAGRGARYVGYFLLHFGLPWLPALLLAIPRLRVDPAWRRHPLLPACAVVSLVWTASVVALGGDYMAFYRFFVPILPPLALLLAAALRALVRGVELRSQGARSVAVAAIGCGFLGTLLQSTPLEALVFDVPSRMHGNYRGVLTERWHVARLTSLASLFAKRAQSPEDSVATDAIGALGWYSGLRVYGAHGLVDPEIAHQGAREHAVGEDYAGHDRRDLARLFDRDPTFFMFTREVRPTRPPGIALPPEYVREVAGRYVLRSVWLDDSENGESGWFNFLERTERGL
ncbi:MAG: hypothetical protein QF890_09945 [Myxococcota bacterium]|nr:hypothetical protein [bacterium]MDP6076531.1 hypothetical protein [Myxococcota bacterium]MDP6243010.1 hypothetical protein [Myxococcota bacterium]MDP7075711.1 hypothetical protein [Myxococcota bacterium]MDP7297939.1 hypothetical protein [Myxococcota bacterium]